MDREKNNRDIRATSPMYASPMSARPPCQQVSQKARAVGGNQHPVMKGELEGVLPLVTVKGR